VNWEPGPAHKVLLRKLPVKIFKNPTVAPYEHWGVEDHAVWISNALVWHGLARIDGEYLVRN
jgi:hypothetical protein